LPECLGAAPVLRCVGVGLERGDGGRLAAFFFGDVPGGGLMD